MPLSIMKAQWLSETSVTGAIRDANLVRLDTAIGTGNPHTTKDALRVWIGAQTAANQDWKTHQRNRSGAFTRLYDELGLANDVKPFMDKLVHAAANCRAGSRVLQVNNPLDVPPMQPAALMWVAVGMREQVEEDSRNVMAWYEALRELNNPIRVGSASKVLLYAVKVKPLNGVQLGGPTFSSWARDASESCAEMGSGDVFAWSESICNRAGLNWDTYRFTLEVAKLKGEKEQEAFEAAKLAHLRQNNAIDVPGDGYFTRHTPIQFLKELVTRNRGKPDHELCNEYKIQCTRIIDLLMANNSELPPWDDARRGNWAKWEKFDKSDMPD